MADVYETREFLEDRISLGHAHLGVLLVVTNDTDIVQPKTKGGKRWAYDISDRHRYPGGPIAEPLDGKEIDVRLSQSYIFNWRQFNSLKVLEVEPVAAE